MKYKSILILIAIALISSVILSFIPIEQACGLGDSGCYAVQTSPYEKTLGFQNAHLGLIAFTILFIITFLHEKKPTKKRKQIIAAGLILGSIFAIYFLTIQIFILNAICKYCMATDIGIILALTIFLFVKDKK